MSLNGVNSGGGISGNLKDTGDIDDSQKIPSFKWITSEISTDYNECIIKAYYERVACTISLVGKITNDDGTIEYKDLHSCKPDWFNYDIQEVDEKTYVSFSIFENENNKSRSFELYVLQEIYEESDATFDTKKNSNTKNFKTNINIESRFIISQTGAPYLDLNDTDNLKSYYNSKFSYTSTGYHNNEIYRFGIVYIRKDGSLTKVYNILGINGTNTSRPSKFPQSKDLDGSVSNIYWNGSNLTDTYNETEYNIKGICLFKNVISDLRDIIGIKFTFPDWVFNTDDEKCKRLREKYKGYFFVRLKRIPTILALGYTTNISQEAYLPSINIPYETGSTEKLYMYEAPASTSLRFDINNRVPNFFPTTVKSYPISAYTLTHNYKSRLFTLTDYTWLYLDKIYGKGPVSAWYAEYGEEFTLSAMTPYFKTLYTYPSGTDQEYLILAYHCSEQPRGYKHLTDNVNEKWGCQFVHFYKKVLQPPQLILYDPEDDVYPFSCYNNQRDKDTSFHSSDDVWTPAMYTNVRGFDWSSTITSVLAGTAGGAAVADLVIPGIGALVALGSIIASWISNSQGGGKDYYNRNRNVLTFDPGDERLDGLGLELYWNQADDFYWKIDGEYYKDYCGFYTHAEKADNGFLLLKNELERYMKEYESNTSITKDSQVFEDATISTFDGKYLQMSDKNVSLDDEDYWRLKVHPMQDGTYGVFCPEYELNLPYYNSIFTGLKCSIFPITEKKLLNTGANGLNFRTRNFLYTNTNILNDNLEREFNTIGVADGISLLKLENSVEWDKKRINNNNQSFFSSKAGDASDPSIKFVGGKYICYLNLYQYINEKKKGRLLESAPINIARGLYGPYVGISYIGNGNNYKLDDLIVEIRIPEFSFSNMLKYFQIRAEDSGAYYSISDKFTVFDCCDVIPSLKDIVNNRVIYRGDCYISWYTHRVNRNFNDSAAPYNDTIVDVSGFTKPFIKCFDQEYRTFNLSRLKEESDDKRLLGVDSFNIGDLNAIQMGSWITFPVRSTINVALRSQDSSNIAEKLACGQSRGFYPLGTLDAGGNNKISESFVYNQGYNKSGNDRLNFAIDNAVYINTYYKNTIIYSNVLLSTSLKNGNRIFLEKNLKNITDQYGSITKLISLGQYLICICEHGILKFAINSQNLISGTLGTIYINTNNIISEPIVLSEKFGSQHIDSIIKTNSGIYGVDVANCKIWITDGESVKCISDYSLQKFLNDNLYLSSEKITECNLRTHHNAFKNDVMFTLYDITPYYKDDPNTEEIEKTTPDNLWNLCWNENQLNWITYYSWIPLISNNIGNAYISIDALNYLLRESALSLNYSVNYIWKHGQSNRIPTLEKILPTNWYGKIHPFEFEFVVNKDIFQHKIFDTMQIISNKAKPESFHYEVIGESYDFAEDKQTAYIRLELTKKMYSELTDSSLSYTDVSNLNSVQQDKSTIFPMFYHRENIKNLIYDNYKHLNEMLENGTAVYNKYKRLIEDGKYDYDALSGTELIYYPQFEEFRLCNHVKAVDISKKGSLRGNMRYVEDMWNIQITPINYMQKNEYHMVDKRGLFYKETLWETNKPPIVISALKELDLKLCNITLDQIKKICETGVLDWSVNYYSDDQYAYDKFKLTVVRKETRIRDKFMKVKIRYSGDELATILGINTQYTISYFN